jgi:DNA polymerase (family 10)
LVRDGLNIGFASEEDFFSELSITPVPPELREAKHIANNSFKANVASLVTQLDLKADLHVHTTYSDGKNSLEDMVKEAISRNLKIIAITDHSPSLLPERYSDESYIFAQIREIDELRKKYSNRIEILKGVEADILPDGQIDLSSELAIQLDIVVASLHVALNQPREIITPRLIRAIENPLVNIIGHPGGRLYPLSDITDLDWERIFRAAAYNHVALEINSHKSHPIFDDEKVSQAASLGVDIALNSDSHNSKMLEQSRFGVAIARRAGLTSEQIINCWSYPHLKLWLKRRNKLL